MSERKDSDMTQIVLGKYLLTVDSKTSQQILNDDVFAQTYLEQLNEIETREPRREHNYSVTGAQVEGNEQGNKVSTNSAGALNKGTQNKVWSTRVQTESDKAATFYFLGLRKNLNNKFADKCTPKNSLWQQIAMKMNEADFFVGDGIEGREKCRQKFVNLQSSYMKYIDKKRNTGEGKIEKPPFFDEVEEILGEKDKSKPALLIDSFNLKKTTFEDGTNKLDELDEMRAELDKGSSGSNLSSTTKSANSSHCLASTSNCTTPSSSCSSHTGSADRFKKKSRTIVPNKNEILEKFYDLAEKSEKRQEKEFTSVLQLMREESEKRHEQMMSLISAFSKSNPKKRRRHGSSEESD